MVLLAVSGRSTLGQLLADLGDVAKPTFTGLAIEAEAGGQLGVGQERQLHGMLRLAVGTCCVLHASMMNGGCHRVPGGAFFLVRAVSGCAVAAVAGSWR